MKENEKNDTLHALCYAVSIIFTSNLQGMPKICQIYIQNLFPDWSKEMPNICPRYISDMPKICTRYV